ncbi:hypothetical protein GCM10007216_39330 [Thalassobacillus devorans]|uniref:Voltage-gated potassium channel n=1 Tax=Thalassobacillus devorans TaxID=279813 RepID=A0ABQ1PVN1_9BACI|nr:hypothetical protein [Thalassobacillus devorans]NIK30858.1 voltage-gated potassium channel [Thalassobacillus devorans]GGD04826.1 hypothetical protein GCM10007216_39330 [Thalassobacillus devorans]
MGFFTDRTKKQTTYEIFMLLLATLSVATIWKKTGYDSYIVWTTWAIFFLDFLYRLFNSKSKWGFIKEHPFIVIAAIPLDAVFQFARFARILHLLRLKSITKFYTKPIIRYLKGQHLSLVAGLTAIAIFLAIIPLYQFESGVESYWEAMLGALTAITFFGRTAFEPSTGIGQTIVVILTIFGVILHGLIISTAFDMLYHSKWVQSFVKKLKNR